MAHQLKLRQITLRKVNNMAEKGDYVHEIFESEPWEDYVESYTDEEEEVLLNGTEYYDEDLTPEEQGSPFSYDFQPEWMEEPEIFYSVYSVAFGELLQTGYDWGRDIWTSTTMTPDVLSVVRLRLNRKIEDEFYQREINIEIPKQWSKKFVRRLEDLVDKYGPIYNEIAGGIDLTGIHEYKARSVNSEYPQALVNSSNQDYLSNGNLTGYEDVSSKTTLEALREFDNFFQHPDEKILKGLDIMFSHYPYFLDSQIGSNQGFINNYYYGGYYG